jgi:2,3,4,5-tetrahydropyridine-2-carboxylate N-succinyltransferase
MAIEYKKLIEDAWEDRQLLEYKEYQEAIESVILKLDRGELRVAEPIGSRWHVNEWIKKAVILYFPIQN